jgi:hypothetical protein
MRSCRFERVVVSVLSGISILCSGTAAAEEGPPAATARVTYIAGSSVYLDKGREEGIAVGDRLEVVRAGVPVARLEVRDVSSHRAACAVLEGSEAVRVGDEVRYAPHPVEGAQIGPPPPEAPKRATASAEGGRGRRGRIRGRVGIRYLWVKDRGEAGGSFSQPSLDLKLDGSGLAGGPVELAVDVRARRTSRSFSDGTTETDGRSRVYRGSLSWNAARSGLRISLGRQLSPSLATLSIFDGISVEIGRPGWSLGSLTGTQPDPVSFGISSRIREHGVYVRWHSRPEQRRSWSWTTGLIGSYTQGEINREFLYLQGQFVGRALSAYLAQEVDYNRGWKAEVGESTLSSTSTFATVRLRAGRNVDLLAGFDNRRQVRLFRDRTTPETDFDDTFRRGAWIGATGRFAGHYEVGADARSSGGGAAGGADSQSLRFAASDLGPWRLRVTSRSTRYANDVLSGWLQSVGIGIAPGSRFGLELSGGVRLEDRSFDPDGERRLTWLAADADIGIGRHFYLLLSAERDRGTLEGSDQYYASLTYRF